MARSRVLIIGEEDGSPRSLAGDFMGAGFEVTTSDGGAEGLRMAQAIRPDVILLDLSGTGGVEVSRDLRADEWTRQVPILLLTSEGDGTSPMVAALGADDTAARPVSHAVLLAKVKALLRRVREKADPAELPEWHQDSEQVICGTRDRQAGPLVF